MKLLESLIFIEKHFILSMNSHVQQTFIEDLLCVPISIQDAALNDTEGNCPDIH